MTLQMRSRVEYLVSTDASSAFTAAMSEVLYYSCMAS